MCLRVLVLVWSLCFWGALADKGNATELRLVGGASRCEGAVELKHRGEWRRLTAPSTFDLWDLKTAGVVCRELNCGAAVSVGNRTDFNQSKVWTVRYPCLGKSPAAAGCVWDRPSAFDVGLELACSDSVRLVSGRSLCSGSLQIRDRSSDQSWTPVCEGALDRRGAKVLCRELGCGAPLLQGALSPLGQTFHCEGHESALMDCPRSQTRTCSGPALNLTCSEPVRLVGGPSRCEGTLEVKHGGEWTRAAPQFDLFDPWDLESAAVVCRELDCGSAVSTERRKKLPRSEVLFVRPECVKKAAVRDCVSTSVSEHKGLTVKCSGHQAAPEETQRTS